MTKKAKNMTKKVKNMTDCGNLKTVFDNLNEAYAKFYNPT